MSAPASEDLREIERELTNAAEQGESRSRAELQERFDMAGPDLQAALDTLREHGKAVEESPGQWRGPTIDELDRAVEPERVTVRTSAEPDGEAEEDEQVTLARQRGERFAARIEYDRPNVRLTRAIADALDAAALGQIVKAAVDSSDEDETFVFEVTP